MQNRIPSQIQQNRVFSSIAPSIRSSMFLIAAMAQLYASTLCLAAGQAETAPRQTDVSARYIGALEPDSAGNTNRDVAQTAGPLAVTAATPAPAILSFNLAVVGVAAGSAQQLTASFSVSGYSGSFTPSATLHYGHDYSIGAVTCTPSGASETCNAPVTFRPSLPGARKDAIFLMDGSTRLATVLLSGVGQGPLSLIQPGAFSTSVPTNEYIYQSVADENGVVYILPNGNTPYIERVTEQGVATQISLTKPPYFWTIGIDGAGVLYLFNETSTVTTYDTVLGIQGTYQIPPEPQGADPTDDWFPGALGVDGSIYVVDQIRNNGVAYQLKPDGTTAYADTFNPGVLQPFTAAVDSAGDFFVGGYEINKITPAGVQTQVNTVGASEGLAVDAADTLYATRYNPTDGVAELAASDYSTPIASFGRSSPLGLSLGSDGTLYVSNYVNLDIFDRSSTETVDFGEIDAGSSSTLSTASVYNGGNQPLTISGFTLSGTGFSLDPNAAKECAAGTVLAPGALCQASVIFAPGHPGTFSGTITVDSDSLNGANTIQTIQLTGISYGSYDVLSPSPLVFPSHAPGTSNTLAVTMTNDGNYYASTIYSAATNNPAFTIAQGTCSGGAVQVGTSCQLQVTFRPSAAQAYTGNATIVTYVSGSGQPFQTITLQLSGTSVNPPAATPVISPGSGTYTTSQQVTITDATANAAIYFTTDGSNPSTASTKYTGAITVNSDETVNAIATAPGYTQSSTASATFTFHEAVATVTPTSLAFSNQILGIASVAQTVALKNTGIGALNLTGFPITGSADFSQTNNCVGSLTAGSSCTLSIVYTPTSLGGETATLTVNSDSIHAAPTVTLTGTGIAPPAASLSPASLNFRSRQEGLASGAMILTLSNPNSATALNFDSISISGVGSASFSQTNDCGAAIAAGGNCSISVIFNPAAIGALSATLSVVTRYPGFGPVSISSTLSGIGTALPAPTFTPTTFAFGNQAVSTTSARLTTTLSNPGADTLVIDGALPTIVGAGADSISATSNCPATLAPAATCTVSATFTPSSLVAYSLSLQMTAHYSGEPSIKFTSAVALTGTGINAPPPAFTPASLAFGSQTVGTTNASQTITLNNPVAASQPVEVDNFSLLTKSFQQTNNCPHMLAAGSSCQIKVSFAPDSAGPISDTLNLEYIEAGMVNNLFAALNGTGINPPPPAFTPTALAFGKQIVGTTSASQTITLTNPAAAAQPVELDIFSLLTKSFQQTNNCPATLAAGSSCQIKVSFAPNSAAPISDTLNLEYIEAGMVNNLFAALNGTGVNPPPPTFTPASLASGSQTVGTTSASQTITLTNPASGFPITIDFSTLVTKSFQQTNNCPATLAAGASCQYQVIFTPQVVGAITDTLQLIYDQGGSEYNTSAALSGIGTAPPPPVISMNPAALSFGNQIQGTTSPAKTVTVSNSGQGSLVISEISLTQNLPGIFTQTNNCVNVVIPPGGSCTISVTFAPASANSFGATIEIDNSNGLPSQTVALTGTGIAPLASLAPASMSFTTTTGTTSAAQTATLTNVGSTPLSIFNISVSGASANDYHQTNNCGTLLAEAASCTISVTFTPASSGSYPKTLTVSDSDPASPQTIALTGSATTTPDFVIASSTPQQTILPGGTAQFSLTVTAQNGATIPAVQLAATGLPPGATATFSHSAVTPDSTSATSMLTINTASSSAAVTGFAWPLATPAFALAGLFFVPAKRRRRWAVLGLLLIASLSGLITLSGCGGSTLPPAKSYPVTITGTIGTVQQTTTVQLTVR